MPGLFQGLELGKRALLTHQFSLQTIGHNIANVNTPGYTRQRVRVNATYPEDSAVGQVGTGVTAIDVRHIRDLFLGEQFREATKSAGEWSYKHKSLTQIESMFNEPQDGSMNELLNNFWDSWSELATNSDSTNNRKLIVAQAEELINGIQQLAKKLNSLQASIDRDMQTMTQDVNRYARQIASLNQQIKTAEIGDERANDLRDARDLLTDELSRLIDVRTVEKDNGATIVYMGSMVIVDGSDSFAIDAETENVQGQPISRLVWKDNSYELKNIHGEMAGLMQSRDVLIPGYLDQLNELARGLVEEVNAIHGAGYTADGDTGINFFDPNFTDALTIRLSSAVRDNINNIVAASTPDGDNQVALQLSQLRDQAVLEDNTLTINDFYASLVGKLGVETNEAESFTSNFELLIQQIETSRQAVQGVSLDEEMANLVKFQHAYDAAARVITSMDQALDTVIRGMGIVGR